VLFRSPGQGHEACFFDALIPIETINTNGIFVDYFKENITLESPVVIVAPHTEYIKKARKFQKKLKQACPHLEMDYAAFFQEDQWSSGPGVSRAATSEFLGNVAGADVVIVDDIVDTAGSLSVLCRRLKKEGARRVYVCASHGLFSEDSMNLIDLSPVERVVVSDSVPMPKSASNKIVQVSTAGLISRIIESEVINFNVASAHKNVQIAQSMQKGDDDDEFEMD